MQQQHSNSLKKANITPRYLFYGNIGRVILSHSQLPVGRQAANERWKFIEVLFKQIFSNGPSHASFSFIFVFSNKHYNFTSNKWEKCPSSVQCWDSSSQPSEHESPPITTRPGFPPDEFCCLWMEWKWMQKECKKERKELFKRLFESGSSRLHLIILFSQCDQMCRLWFQYLTI